MRRALTLVRNAIRCGALIAMGASTARAGLIDDIRDLQGTIYVLISNQTPTGGSASTTADGVWKLSRVKQSGATQATDADYRITQLPSFPVNSARGLGVDKFGRVFVSDASSTSSHNVLTEGSSHTVNATVKCDSSTYTKDYETGYLAEIKPDGTVTYPGTALWTKVANTSETQYPIQNSSNTASSQTIDGETVSAPSSVTPGAYVYDKYTFNGSSANQYLPPPFHVLGPASHGRWHGLGVSLYTYGNGPARNPFPTQGMNIPISLKQSFVDTNHTTLGSSYHGWEVRNWKACTFSVTPYLIYRYCDTYAANTLGCSPTRLGIPDPIYTSLGFSANSDIFNCCGDACYSQAASPGVSGQSAEARANFSTFGQDPNEQKMFVALMASGNPSVMTFASNASGGWDRDVIVKPGYIKSGWSPFVTYRPGTTDINFQTVGNSAFDGNHEFLYLSNKPTQQFSVSSNFYRQGGIIYELSTDGNSINTEEFITGQASNLGTIANVPAGSSAITADGQDNVYMLRIERSPGGPDGTAQKAATLAAINASIPGSNPIPSNYMLSPYYLGDHVVPSSDGYSRDVYFDRAVGLNVYKTNRFNKGMPVPIALDANGNPTVIAVGHETVVGKVKFDSPTTAHWYAAPDGSTINGPAIGSVNNRFEVASVNVALPPPVSDLNTVDLLYYGSTAIPSNDAAVRTTPVKMGTGVVKGDTHTQIIDVAQDTAHFMGLENPPVFGGTNRTVPLVGGGNASMGYSNIADNSDKDNDKRSGSFSTSLMWGPDTTLGAGHDLMFAWSCENITFHDAWAAGDSHPAGEAERGWKMTTMSPYTGTPTADTGSTASLNWFKAQRDSSLRVYDPWCQFRFYQPGKYRVRLYTKGYYWNLSLGNPASLNNPAFFFADGFGGNPAQTASGPVATGPNYGEMVVNVKAGPPTDGNFVDQLAPKMTDPSRTAQRINQGDKPPIFATGRVQFFRSYSILKDVDQQQKKQNGVGIWKYSWPYGAAGDPPNSPLTDPNKARNRNDADGDWGTRSVYDAVDDTATNDMLPIGSSGDPVQNVLSSQQIHDWYEIKYQWEMEYFDPSALPLGVTLSGWSDYSGPYILKQGNLAELLVLQAMKAKAALPSWWPATQDCIKWDQVNPRLYEISVPLLDPGRGGVVATNILTPTSSQTGLPPPVSQTFAVKPYVWNVPTDPSFVRLTCKIFYPQVKWDPVKDQTSTTVIDTTGNVLYYNAIPVTGPLAGGLFAGKYLQGGLTTPTHLFNSPFGDGTSATASYQSDNGDDYAELQILGTKTLEQKTIELTRNGNANLGSGAGGQRSDADIAVKLIDNNPYVTFKNWYTVGSNQAMPSITEAFYEFGPNTAFDAATNKTGGDTMGVGPLSTALWGYNLADPAYHLGGNAARDYPGDPEGVGARPTNSTGFLYAPDAETGMTLASKARDGKGHKFSMSLFDPSATVSKYVDLNKPDPSAQDCSGNPMTPGPSGPFTTRTSFCIDDFAGGPGSKCFRKVCYTFPKTEVYLPLFYEGTGMNGLPFLVTATNRAGPVAADIGRISVTDTVPPNLKVMVVNEKTQQALYFFTNGYFGKYTSSGTVAAGVQENMKYFVLKRSKDVRPDLSLNVADYRTANPVVQTAAGGEQTFEFASGGASWDASWVDGAFTVEEDVRLLVKAFAVDNVDPATSLTITISHSTVVPSTEESDQHADASGREASKYIRLIYPQAGMTDTIAVNAKDSKGAAATGSVTIRIPVKVVKNPALFRRVGEH